MLINTNGMVLHSTKYSDTSLIVKIFTEAEGTRSFIVKGAFGKKSKIRATLFSPLALLNLTYDDSRRGQLTFLRDVASYGQSLNIAFDPVRSSILLFYNELLYKLLFEVGEDAVLYRFLETEILELTQDSECPPDRPLRFLIRLSVVLGFLPENNYSERDCHFSLEEGRFQSYCIDERSELPQAESLYLSQLMREDVGVPAGRALRSSLLRYLIQYYIMHNEHLKGIDSVEILASVLH